MTRLPPDIAAQIESFVAAGYGTSEEVLRDALAALTAREGDLAAIREGIAQEAAGDLRPAREVLSATRFRHGLTL